MRRWALIAIVALGCAALPAAAAQASFPGGNGKLVFTSPSSAATRDSEVFTVNPDGAARMQLTNEPAGVVNPRWSPDGTRIAMTVLTDAGPNGPTVAIWTMNADGSSPTKVVDDADWPAWSPDGSKIAFARRPFCARGPVACPEYDLYTVKVDGTGITRVTDHNGLNEIQPDWSPDGSRIAFAAAGDGYDVWTVNLDGGGLAQLTNTPGADLGPTWSPDGTRIGFSSERDEASPSRCGAGCNSEIYTINADGSDPVRVTFDPARDEMAAWSPDGNQFAFARFVCGLSSCTDNHLYRINVDGSGMTAVTSGPQSDYEP